MLEASGHRLVGAADAPELVIADVNRCDPGIVLSRHPDVPVLGFGRHTDAGVLRAARAAGFAKVVPRSVLAERLPELVAELAGEPGARGPSLESR